MTVEENHKLDVKFVDKGGKPITGIGYTIESPDKKTMTGILTGRIEKSGLKEGDYEVTLKTITKAEWSENQARVGDKVKLMAETEGIESGEKANFEIFIRDTNFADHLLKTLDAAVDGGKIETEWELQIDNDLIDDQDSKEEKGGYSHPVFYFIVKAGGISARSAILEYKDFIEIELKDGDGNIIGEAGYKVILPDGVIKEGTLDSNGYVKVENIPPGRVKVMFDTETGGK
jgi:hypothetical protein